MSRIAVTSKPKALTDALAIMNKIELDDEDDTEIVMLRDRVHLLSITAWRLFWRTMIDKHAPGKQISLEQFLPAQDGKIVLESDLARLGEWRSLSTPDERLKGCKEAINLVYQVAKAVTILMNKKNKSIEEKKITLRFVSFRTRLYAPLSAQPDKKKLINDIPDIKTYVAIHSTMAKTHLEQNDDELKIETTMDSLYRLFGFGFGGKFTVNSLSENNVLQVVQQVACIKYMDEECNWSSVTKDEAMKENEKFLEYHLKQK